VITQGLVWRLGLSQLLCWGLSYYLIGVLGERIVADTGWSATLVYSGFSGALVVMGLASPLLGRFVDRHGGRPVMMAGSLLLAAGCVGLSLARDLVSYGAAWACLGLAMRMTLYEAAFAALARIGGASARRPIAQTRISQMRTRCGDLKAGISVILQGSSRCLRGWRWTVQRVKTTMPLSGSPLIPA
jgi:MFS family permease